MPTREAIVDSVIPREIERPIPVRTISTRSKVKVQDPIIPQNAHQAAISENNPAAASATTEEYVRLSPQLSALARKEQAFRQREQALKQREKDLEAKLVEAEQFAQLKTKVAAKDYSEVEKLGMTYEDHTKYLLDRQNGEDPQAQKFKTIEDELHALKKSQEESNADAFEETVRAYRTELTSHIDSSPELSIVKKFKDTDHEGKEFTGADVALQFILDSWKEDQEEITVADAAKLTKQFLTEKRQQWTALVDEPKQVEAEAKPLPPPKLGAKTLTNQMQPGAGEARPHKSLQHMSESERYAEARRRVLARRQQQGT